MADESMLGIQAKVDKEIGCMALDGRLVAESRYGLERTLREWNEAGINRVVISMKDLQYLDSAGLSTLIGALHRMRRVGGDLLLCDLNPRLTSMFEITSIAHYVKVFGSEHEALQHFRKIEIELKKKAKPPTPKRAAAAAKRPARGKSGGGAAKSASRR